MPGLCIIVRFCLSTARFYDEWNGVCVCARDRVRSHLFVCRLFSYTSPLSKQFFSTLHSVALVCIEYALNVQSSNGPRIVYLNLIANRSIFHVNSMHAPIRQMQMHTPNQLISRVCCTMRCTEVKCIIYWCLVEWDAGSALVYTLSEGEQSEWQVWMRFWFFVTQTLRFCGMAIFWLQCPKRKLIPNMRVKHSKNSALNRRKAHNKYGTINELLSYSISLVTTNKPQAVLCCKIRIRTVFRIDFTYK